MTAVDRTPKPCLHPVAQHEHGTHACYALDGCRCYPCAAAQSAYEIDRLRQHAYGRWDNLVDAEPARAHVRSLMADGIGWKRVANMAGVGHSSVGHLLYGRPGGAPSQRIKKETAAALLAVTSKPTNVAGGVRIDATGTRRRLQALVACGWSQSKLAGELGWLRGNFRTLMKETECTAATARTVTAMYDRLWDTPPPEHDHRSKIAASRARNLAAARGWLPPLAWDDDTIDDLAARPFVPNPTADETLDEIKVQRLMAGALKLPLFDRSPERVEAVRRLAARGLTDRQIGDQLGMSPDAVLKQRQRNDIPAGQPIDVIAAGSAQSEDVTAVPTGRTPAA